MNGEEVIIRTATFGKPGVDENGDHGEADGIQLEVEQPVGFIEVGLEL